MIIFQISLNLVAFVFTLFNLVYVASEYVYLIYQMQVGQAARPTIQKETPYQTINHLY